MEQVVLIESTVLVGWVCGKNYTPARLRKLTAKVWGNLMMQLPGVITLYRGWFALIFSQPDQVDWVLTRYWHIEMMPVLFKH